jgi:hypothetical protein
VLGIGARITSGRWSDRIHARIAPMRLIGVALASPPRRSLRSSTRRSPFLIPAPRLRGVLSMA